MHSICVGRDGFDSYYSQTNDSTMIAINQHEILLFPVDKDRVNSFYNTFIDTYLSFRIANLIDPRILFAFRKSKYNNDTYYLEILQDIDQEVLEYTFYIWDLTHRTFGYDEPYIHYEF